MLHASQSWRHDGWVVIPVITLWSQLEVCVFTNKLWDMHRDPCSTIMIATSPILCANSGITTTLNVLSTLQYKAPNHNCCCWINKIELNWTEPFVPVQRIPAPTGIISWMIVISTQTKPPSTKPKQETTKLYFLCLYVCMLKKSQNDCTPLFSSVAHVRG